MTENYENIVIGAGLAGTICSGFLAKYGQKTLLLERGKKIGGQYSDIKFDGYTVAMHLPMLMTTWNGGFWSTAARELEANLKFYYSKEPKFYVNGAGMPPISVPRCYTASAMVDFALGLMGSHGETLPSDAKQEFTKIMGEILGYPWKQMCVDLDNVGLKDWVESRSTNPVVRALFTNLGSSMGFMGDPKLSYETSSAAKVFTMIRGWLAGEGVTAVAVPNPVDGIIKPLADAFVVYGGEIRTGHRATKIQIENGKAVGVVVKNEKEEVTIRADRVIVACVWSDIPKLFIKMPAELEGLFYEPSKIKMGNVWTFTGLKRPITHEPSCILVQDPKTGANLGGAYAESVEQPWNAPEGKQLIWMYQVLAGEKLEKATKEELVAEMNDIQEAIYPGFKEAMEVQHSAYNKQSSGHYPLSCFKKIPQKSTTIEGLYFTGEGTTPSFGCISDGVASTGISTAKKVLGLDILCGI